jgi:hypothetical protein
MQTGFGKTRRGAIGAYLSYVEGGAHLGMSDSGIGYAVERGEASALNNNY